MLDDQDGHGAQRRQYKNAAAGKRHRSHGDAFSGVCFELLRISARGHPFG